MDEPTVDLTIDAQPDKRVKLRPFRHPYISGRDIDPVCGQPFSKHGWIDSYDNNGFGLTVCPLNWNGDWE